MTTIGDRLREERTRLGLSQTDIASTGGVGKTTQINYEKNERQPDAGYLSAVSVVGVDVLYVLTGHRTPESSDALSEDEALVLNQYRSLPDQDKASVARLTTALAEMVRAART